jgi:hypothetical protein
MGYILQKFEGSGSPMRVRLRYGADWLRRTFTQTNPHRANFGRSARKFAPQGVKDEGQDDFKSTTPTHTPEIKTRGLVTA